MKHLIYALIAGLLLATSVRADVLKLAVTTSFNNSGLADVLVPEIEKDLGIDLQLLVVGTGQALRLGAAGDVDAILVHARAAEEAFIAEGHAAYRREIMYNDFIIVGPQADPAGVRGATRVEDAFRQIAAAGADFVSRGDDSGTHKKELSLWVRAGERPDAFSSWYRAVGAGMGAALNTAAALDAYILADRASWLNFGNQQGLSIVFEGDKALFNQYSYLPVSAVKHPHVQKDLAHALDAWLISAKAKELIDGYQIEGKTLFVFNAVR